MGACEIVSFLQLVSTHRTLTHFVTSTFQLRMQLRSLDLVDYQRGVLPIIKRESSWLCNSSNLPRCWFSQPNLPFVEGIDWSVGDSFAVLGGDFFVPLLFPVWNSRDSRKEPRRN